MLFYDCGYIVSPCILDHFTQRSETFGFFHDGTTMIDGSAFSELLDLKWFIDIIRSFCNIDNWVFSFSTGHQMNFSQCLIVCNGV